ncbi:MAG: hypothetical protein O7D30_09170 [Rickettsia endosymbiont of Ixodes persulcatus]|nr:hypothetical protein [Rickettsia endosymbiont of Ixodes persulcatus]
MTIKNALMHFSISATTPPKPALSIFIFGSHEAGREAERSLILFFFFSLMNDI